MLRAELNQSILKGGQKLPASLVRKVLSACERGMKKTKAVPLSVAFIGEREMRDLNRTYRGKDKVTDVLSFEEVGEILICYPQAKRQAAAMGHSVRDELVFLLVHGVLHAFGYDHERPNDAKHMFPLQTRILTGLGIDPRL